MHLDDRLKWAWDRFVHRADDHLHARVHELVASGKDDIRELLGRGRSQTTPHELARILAVLEPQLHGVEGLPDDFDELFTRVEPNGSLLGCGKWELLDIGWLEAMVGWLEHLDDRAPFCATPSSPPHLADGTRLLVAGDWGTGYWRQHPQSPAERVAQQMELLRPDITLHLGDVYYAGTAEQERENLVALWPRGRQASYTLNSNHEMYDGARSYFHALQTSFTDQGGCSFFSLQNDDWVVAGLDSAFHASRWSLYMKGRIKEVQQQWLRGLPERRGIVLFSHHPGFDLAGTKTTELYDQVIECLLDDEGRSRYEQIYWFWGHAHNAVVYEDRAIPGGTLRARCIGHGAIPYGSASALAGEPQVAWYETELAHDHEVPVRVLNGFADLRFEGAVLREALISEAGTTRWAPGSVE